MENVLTNNFEEPGRSLGEWIEVIQRRFKEMLITFVSAFVVVMLIAFLWPPTYQSSSTILIEQQEIPQDMVRSTITSFADQRIQVINQRVMTTSNLMEIINKFALYQELRETEPREVVLEEIRDDINMSVVSADVIDPRSGRPMQATIAFTISYQSESPSTAYKVANELTSLYLDENLKTRTQMAQDATSFLQEQSETLQEEISVLENKLSEFKQGNVEKLPELVALNLNLMDRTDEQIREVDRQLRALRERKIYLESELAQMNPQEALYSEDGDRILGSADRLRTLQSRLVQLSASYSNDHPDIIRTRREIKSLQAEVGGQNGTSQLLDELQSLKADLATAREKYSQDHPDIRRMQRAVAAIETSLAAQTSTSSNTSSQEKIRNPAYAQLKAQHNAANSEISSLLVSRKQLESKMQNYEQRLVDAPEVEREFRALTRDYNNAQVKYADIKAKLTEARLGESLESGRKGERFTLIEPALRPQQPVSPNRILILLIGIIFSLMLAFAVMLIRETLDDKVYGKQALLNLTGFAPIAMIPSIVTPEENATNKKNVYVWAGFVATGFLLLLILVHFFVQPIDVIWYRLIRMF